MERSNLRRLSLVALALSIGCSEDGMQPEGPPPSLSAVAPAVGTVGTELHLSGNSFRAGATVRIGTLAAPAVEVSGPTDAYVLVPEGVVAGTSYDVQISNSDGGSVTLPLAFQAIAPRLTFVNSATLPSGNTGSTVILEGDAFGDVRGVGQVLFSNGAGGTVAATISDPADWTDTFIVTTLPGGAQDGPVVVTNSTGSSSSLYFNVTQNAAFSPSTIQWTQTTAMPEALSGHAALHVPIATSSTATVQRVYVLGGMTSTGAPTGQVRHSIIQESGGLAPWINTTALPAPVAFAAAVAATPFNSKVPGVGRIFVIGGQSAGAPTTNVWSMTLDSLGNVAAAVPATPLPVPLRSTGAVIFRGHIYVAGGASTSDAPVASVYRATIDTLGAIGSWTQLPALPSARSAHGLQVFGGYLYAVGGDGGTVTSQDPNTSQTGRLDEVAYARFNIRSGDLMGAWTVNGSRLGKVRSKHSTLAVGGNLFVSAGLYSAAQQGSSENTYAQINSDGTVTSFGGATGTNTLESIGAGNLFNHAAIVYVDGRGVAHVMVLGGDSVNSPGTRSARVFYY
jgi:hypothetical protein